MEREQEEPIDAFAEYNYHGDVLNVYWGRLTEERPDFQFFLLDDDEILARAYSLPMCWDGTVGGLPDGIDGAIVRGFDEDGANVLCAMLIAIPPNHRGRALSAIVVAAMRDLAVRHGLTALIAPVRPNWKERYPLVPIEEYATWTRADGLAVRSVDARSRTGRRHRPQTRAAVIAHQRQRRGVGRVDADGVSAER